MHSCRQAMPALFAAMGKLSRPRATHLRPPASAASSQARQRLRGSRTAPAPLLRVSPPPLSNSLGESGLGENQSGPPAACSDSTCEVDVGHSVLVTVTSGNSPIIDVVIGSVQPNAEVFDLFGATKGGPLTQIGGDFSSVNCPNYDGSATCTFTSDLAGKNFFSIGLFEKPGLNGLDSDITDHRGIGTGSRNRSWSLGPAGGRERAVWRQALGTSHEASSSFARSIIRQGSDTPDCVSEPPVHLSGRSLGIGPMAVSRLPTIPPIDRIGPWHRDGELTRSNPDGTYRVRPKVANPACLIRSAKDTRRSGFLPIERVRPD